MSIVISLITAPPFEWRIVNEGVVHLKDASEEGGTTGGSETVAEFWMAKYPVTNAQFQCFIDDPDGYRNMQWWEFSPQARQWHVDHPHPRTTAFAGDLLPRTRVSWFEGVAFCRWLTAKITGENGLVDDWVIRMPTEQEWQRAAVGDTGWVYPWGNSLNHLHANYGNQVGQPTPVNQYQQGQSPYGVLDMSGNVWERYRRIPSHGVLFVCTTYQTFCENPHPLGSPSPKSQVQRFRRRGCLFVEVAQKICRKNMTI